VMLCRLREGRRLLLGRDEIQPQANLFFLAFQAAPMNARNSGCGSSAWIEFRAELAAQEPWVVGGFHIST